jgi:DNA-binding CsgD family transcriptional regulator
MAALTAGGVQSESELPYSALHILLQPVFSASRQLPEPRHAALRAAFGIENARAPEPLLMCLAALELLSKTAAVAPLLVLIDDAQWLDDQTADVLTFVARRVEGEPIVMLFALRDGPPARVEQAALTELRVPPLNAAASATVLNENVPELTPAIRGRVLSEALGNPLALRELPRAVGAGTDLSSAVPLPLTERLERAFAAPVSAVPKAARPLLLVAALDRTGNPQRIAAAAAALAGRPVGRAEFSAALDAGAMTRTQNVIRFAHPLVRSAVYHAALPLELEAAHAALAAVYADDPLWSSWHKAAVLSGPHDLLSAALEKAAEEALRSGASSAACLAFERAGELTTDDQRRVRLLARTAKLDFELGRGNVEEHRLRQALQSDLSPADRKQAAASLGFAPLAERAGQELRGAGERVRRRAPGAHAELTRQELQIAQLAAAGLTNREIGQKLYLSHRTIGYHLHRIFPKLGVTTRAQLREALADLSLAAGAHSGVTGPGRGASSQRSCPPPVERARFAVPTPRRDGVPA